MNSEFKGAFICSIVVTLYAIFFHALNVIPNDWASFTIWLPIYLTPIWVIALGVFLYNRKK